MKKISKTWILWFSIIILSFVVSIEPVCASSYNSNSDGTYLYWNQLKTLEQKDVGQDCLHNFTKDKETIKKCSLKFTSFFDTASDNIRHIPIKDVDAEVLSFSSSLVEYFLNISQTYQGVYETLSYAEREGEEAIPQLIFYAVRGFLGDPTVILDSVYKGINTSNQHKSKLSDMEAKLNSISPASKKMKIAEQNLRITLLKKYNRDFPVLSNLI